MTPPGPIIVAVLLLCLPACNPYNPLMGGRDPLPGAERHLSTRNDISPADKLAVLGSKPCPPGVLAQLAESPSREVRSLVAANPSVDAATLEKLLRDKEPGVRGFIAMNEQAPHSILLKLMSDPDYHVRWMLPGNPRWRPDEIREMYARMCREEMTSRPAFTSPSVFAGNPNTPPDILVKLSGDDSYFVQAALAGNPSIPPTAAKRLANSREPSIRRMLASNKAIPENLRRKLGSDPEVSHAAKAEGGN